MEKTVNILTPCYNGEKFIWRLFDSVLNQTYPLIDMIVIDDGSTDHSAELIQSYISRFEAKGYTLTYVYQENTGLSGTINNGLKLITGDYLVWPDIDDWYATNDAIQQMVDILDHSDDDVSMVRCHTYLLDENTFKPIGQYCVNEANKGKTELFEDCIYGINGFWFGAGNYMAKIRKIEELISHKEIFTDRYAGQNWQLMIPLFYKQKCLTIENFLYNILERKASHSREATIEQQLQRYNSYEKTLLFTIGNLANMPIVEKEQHIQATQLRYRTARFELFVFNKQWKEARIVFAGFDGASKIRALFNLVKITVKRLLNRMKGSKR